MPLQIPSIQNVFQRIKSGIFANSDGKINPESPVINAIAKQNAINTSDLYNTIQNTAIQFMPALATEEWAIKNNAFVYTNNRIFQKQAKSSSGIIVVLSESSIDIPSGTEFISNDGLIYKSLVQRTTGTQLFNIASIARINNYAIATLEDHNLGNGQSLIISGANEVEFNGTFDIEILDKDTIRYKNTGVDMVATGSIQASFFGVRLEVESNLTGKNTNKIFTEQLTLIDTITDLNETAYLTFDGISGGVDLEDLDTLKDRTIDFLSKPQNVGSRYSYESFVLNNSVANYAWCYQLSDSEKIYINFILAKDEGENIVGLTTTELLNAKNIFLESQQLILGVDEIDVIFTTPSFKGINFAISGLTPNSVEMKTQIKLSLQDYVNALPIKKFLDSSALTTAKFEKVILDSRDSSGNTPTFTSLTITGLGTITSDNDKAIVSIVNF